MNRKEVFNWGMYDLANTAFSALFVTFFFPYYIRDFLGGNEFQIGLVFGVSMFLVAVLVPLIGAWSDAVNKRMPFIIFFTILACAATALVYFKSLILALILGLVANFCYHAALTTYNALLPRLGKPKEFGVISGIGTAMGYLGTLLSLGMAALLLMHFGWETEIGTRVMFPATALFFFGFSFFMFFGIKEKGNKRKRKSFAKLLGTVWKSVKKFKKTPGIIPYLLAIFMYVNAITAVIIFLYLYGRTEIGMPVQSFMIVYTLFALSAVVGSYYFGKLTDKIGPKRTLTIAGFIWLIVLTILFFVNSIVSFVIGGLIGGIALGAVWTASRPLLISLAPKGKTGEFFGFNELANKFSGILGPIVFGGLVVISGYKMALVSLAVFFVIGLLFLQRVPRK